MKAFHFPRHCLAGIFAVGALLANQPAHAADGTWIETGAGPFDWSLANTASWDSGTVADGIDFTAFFTPDITANQTVNLAENRTIGNITFTDSTTSSHNLTISGANILTLDRTAGIPFIDVTQSGRTLTISSEIAGSDGLQKNGAGTLALSGANTYTGGTTLSEGVLSISNANSLSSGSVSVTGNSRINAAALTYANDISIDASRVLTLGTTGAANSVSTFSGAVTGAGSITLAQGVNQSTVINLSSTSNTFTGDIIMPTAAGTNDFIRFASIGDGGSIIFGRASWLAQARYTGAADIEWDTRTISLATTIGIPSGLDGGGNPSHMFENTGAGIVTINTAMGVTSTAASTIFFLGGTNTGNNTFAGAIADPTGANTLGIGKAGTGKWILSNNTNSYEGNVVLHDGTLSVGVIDVAANAQPLGKGSLIQFGYRTANTGTLEYTGSANADTDKQIQVGQADRANNNNFRGGAVILNNGDGTLTFSNATFNSTTGMSTTGTGHVRNLTLGGTNTGANTISGTIRNNNTSIGALVALSKTGAGTWVLGGDNTYTGTTSVNEGTLLINGNSSTATGAVSVTGGTLGGIGTVGGATSIGAAGTLSPGQSPGTMTFLNTLGLAGSTVMEIDGNLGAGVAGGHDFVNLTGAGAAGVLTYGGTMTIDIGTIFGAGTYSWNLFDFASEGVTSGFTGITLADQYTGSLTDAGGGVWGLVDGGNTWSFTESDGVLGLTVIPEPRAALLGALGLLALLRRRR